MNENFRAIEPKQILDNPFSLIGDDWMLITAGNMEHHNTMTASWGGVGVLWNKPVATIYIRPQRYTKPFVDNNEYFTLSVLPNEMREVLTYCGRKSGKDVDKDKECNLTPFTAVCGNEQSVAYEQARLVLVCRKLYADSIKPECFMDTGLDEKNYPNKDYHQMYIAEIVRVLEKK